MRKERKSCAGCYWYHDWFGLCCNGASEQHGDVSERCELYNFMGAKVQNGGENETGKSAAELPPP